MVEPDSPVQQTSKKPDALLLRRLLYAMMAGEPGWADDHLDFILTIGESDNSNTHGRVWWRMPRRVNDPEGWMPGYVCLNPGEFRLERPDGPNDIVREAPTSTHPRRLSDLLRSQVQLIEPHMDDIYDDLQLLKQQAEKLLQNMQSGNYVEGLNIFREETKKLRANEVTSAQDAVNGLYQNCFLNFLLPGTTFAMAMALLQIQMGLNLWLEDDAYSDVRNYFGSYVGANPKTHPVILEGAAKIGNWHFADGQKRLKEALSSVTLHSFYRELFLAAHHFFAACAIAHDSEQIMPAGQLNYTHLVAEESFSCVVTGLNADLVEFVQGNMDGFEEQLLDYLTNNQYQLAERALRNASRTTNPILPKHYAQVSMARAMIRSGHRRVQQGIEMLESLEKEFRERVTPFEDPTSELLRIELGLLLGYQKIGDEARTKTYATRIAGRAIIHKALRGF